VTTLAVIYDAGAGRPATTRGAGLAAHKVAASAMWRKQLLAAAAPAGRPNRERPPI